MTCTVCAGRIYVSFIHRKLLVHLMTFVNWCTHKLRSVYFVTSISGNYFSWEMCNFFLQRLFSVTKAENPMWCRPFQNKKVASNASLTFLFKKKTLKNCYRVIYFLVLWWHFVLPTHLSTWIVLNAINFATKQQLNCFVVDFFKLFLP